MDENHDAPSGDRSAPNVVLPVDDYLDIVMAEVAQPPVLTEISPVVAKPRIWPALVVGILVVPLAVVVSAVVFLVVMAALVDFRLLRDAVAFEEWLKTFSSSRLGLFVLTLPGQLVFLSVACFSAWLSPVPFRERLKLRRGDLPVWTWGIFALATPAIGTIVSLLMSLVFTEIGSNLEMLENVFREHKGPFLAVVLLLVAVIPGVSEELLFRGYVQSRLLQRLSPIEAITISSLLFAIAHIDPLHIVAVLPLGFWLGYIAWRADSILPSVACHMVNNAVSVVMTHFSKPSGFGIDPNPVTIVILIGCGIALVVSLVLLRYLPRDCHLKNGKQEIANALA